MPMTSRKVIGAAAVAGIVLLYLFLPDRLLAEPGDWLLFAVLAAAFALLDSLPLKLSGGGSARTDAGVATAAIILLDPGAVFACLALGAGLSLLFVDVESAPRSAALDLGRRLAVIYAVAWAYEVFIGQVSLGATPYFEMLIAGGACGLLYAVLDMLGYLFTDGRTPGSSFIDASLGLLKLLGPIYLSQISVGIVLAITYAGLGILVSPILALLMALMQRSFGMLLDIRTAYMRTISALAHLPEMQLNGKRGHAERVADLSAAVGRRLGLRGNQVERLSFAALLHDIGLLGLYEEEGAPLDPADVLAESSRRGADLVAEVDFLAELAPVIRLQAQEPERALSLEPDDLLMAQIIRVCSDYDDLAAAVVDARERLDRLRSSVSPVHSKKVLRALTSVVGGWAR